ncbi:hypothetical protein [Telluribacter sp.]|jgi:hypothetical protein|uniref:hypothetical protein n=1 Tax=Telluribacter sp. TaxID=1978767 RepID=UPI002E0E0B15|nr:hypothetical protein [Telluribacter sp.]
MKYLNYCLLLLFLWGCRDREVSPEVVKPLVGTWHLAAYEETQNGKTVWVELPAGQGYTLQIREDGVLLNEAGLPICCGPSALRINGNFFRIQPKGTLPENPACALALCATCEVWHIDVRNEGQEFFFTCPNSNSGKSRFVRL